MLKPFVSQRKWASVYDFFKEVLEQDESVKDPQQLPKLHPALYLTVYREEFVDLLLENEEFKAARLIPKKFMVCLMLILGMLSQ